MGTMLNPVGPLPPRAYWLRRLLVLLLVVLVVAFVWWLLAGIGGGSPGATGPSTSSSSSPGPSSSSPSATTSQTPSTTSPSPSTPSASGSNALCADSVIKVVAATDQTTYAAGVSPRLTVEVTNTGSASCKRDVGQVALELIVSSGSAHTWSSDDCNPGGSHAIVQLRPGQTFATTVVWGRTRSAPGCPSGKGKADPGHYSLVARNLTLTSAPAAFQLQ